MNDAKPGSPAILIVEDEWVVAQDLADEVASAGFAVIGPAHSLAAALALIEDAAADGALLDVNLRDETSYPVAEILAAKGVPFVFLSGYARGQIEAEFREAPLLSKPVQLEELRSVLTSLVRQA